MMQKLKELKEETDNSIKQLETLISHFQKQNEEDHELENKGLKQ